MKQAELVRSPPGYPVLLPLPVKTHVTILMLNATEGDGDRHQHPSLRVGDNVGKKLLP